MMELYTLLFLALVHLNISKEHFVDYLQLIKGFEVIFSLIQNIT